MQTKRVTQHFACNRCER